MWRYIILFILIIVVAFILCKLRQPIMKLIVGGGNVKLRKNKITLFHGSPFDIKILKPSTPRGDDEFQTQHAVFLGTEKMAQIYAVARDTERKRKYWFVRDDALHMLRQPVDSGYVYIVNVDESDLVKGTGNNKGQYAHLKPIKPLCRYKVKPENINIVWYDDKDSLKSAFKD